MKYPLIMIAGLAASGAILACQEPVARNNAAKLGHAECVNRSHDLAYCIIDGKPFLCDEDRCLPVTCPAILPEVEAGNGTKGDP